MPHSSSVSVAALEAVLRDIAAGCFLALSETEKLFLATKCGSGPDALLACEEITRIITLLAGSVKEGRAAVFGYNPAIHARSARLLYLLADIAVSTVGPQVFLTVNSDIDFVLRPFSPISASTSALDSSFVNVGGAASSLADAASAALSPANNSVLVYLIHRIMSMMEEAKSSIILHDSQLATREALRSERAARRALLKVPVPPLPEVQQLPNHVGNASDEDASFSGGPPGASSPPRLGATVPPELSSVPSVLAPATPIVLDEPEPEKDANRFATESPVRRQESHEEVLSRGVTPTASHIIPPTPPHESLTLEALATETKKVVSDADAEEEEGDREPHSPLRAMAILGSVDTFITTLSDMATAEEKDLQHLMATLFAQSRKRAQTMTAASSKSPSSPQVQRTSSGLI
eukprot:PhF_6_TR17245/c0_g1_i1/m.26456